MWLLGTLLGKVVLLDLLIQCLGVFPVGCCQWLGWAVTAI